ncbi:MAG: hypothetical protein ACP5N2_04280 [Candidatus Nanoarchaeia archaeon]
MHLQRKILILLLLVVVLSTTSNALEISQISLLNAKYEPVTKISPNNAVIAHIKFTYSLSTEETLSDITVNAEEIYPAGIYSGEDYSSLTPLCAKTEETYECIISGLTLKTVNGVLNLYVQGLYNNGTTTTLLQENTTLTLEVDSTLPLVKFLGTEYCTNGVCYIPSNVRTKINIDLEDEDATFEKGNIAFKLGNVKEYVDICDGMNCYGYTKITCQDSQILPLRIIHDGIRSRDDLGNKIQSDPTTLTCDSTPPEIQETSITSAIGLNVLTIENGITFNINVTDAASPTLSIIIEAENIAAGNNTVVCMKNSENDNKFKCTSTITPEIEQPGKYTVKLKVRDIVGNEVEKEVELDLLKTSEEKINLWGIEQVEQSSTSFSRQNMDYERTILAKVDLKSGTAVELLNIKPEGKCYASSEQTGLDSDVVSIKTMKVQGSSIYLKIGIRENSNSRYDTLQKIEFKCPLFIYSKKGNYYYSTYEEDNFTLTINFKDEPALGDKLRSEVNSVTSRVEKTQNVMKYLDQGITAAKTVCNICGELDKTTTITGPIETTLGTAAKAFPAVEPAAKAVNTLNVGIDKFTKGASCEKFHTVCKYFTCDSELAKGATEWMNTPATKNIANAAGYSELSESMNPYKSYTVALATGCIPAVLYHYKTLNGIDCNYLSCISQEYVTYGQDLSSCQEQKTMSTCVFFVGGAIDGIPGANLIRDTSARLGKALKDPIALIGLANPWICKALEAETISHGICVGINNAISSTKIIDDIKKFMNVQEIVAAMGDSSNGCAQIISAAQADDKEWSRVGNNIDAFVFRGEKELSDKRKVICTTDECYVEGASNRNNNDKTKVDLHLMTTTNNDAQTVYMYKDNKLQGTHSEENIRQESMDSGNELNKIYEQLTTKQANAHGSLATEELIKKNQELLALSNELDKQIENIQSGVTYEIDENIFNTFPELKNELLSNPNYIKIKSDLTKLKIDAEITKATIALENIRRDRIQGEYTDRNSGIDDAMDDLEKKEQAYGRALMDATRKQSILDKPINTLSDDEKRELLDIIETNDLEEANVIDPVIITFLENPESLYDEYIRDYSEVSNRLDKSLGDVMKENSEGAKKYSELKKENDKALKDAQDDVTKAARKLRTELRFEDYFGTWQNTAMTSWGAAARISSLRELTNIDWGLFKEDSGIFNIGDAIEHNVITEGEYKLCQSKIDTKKNTGEGVILNVVDEQSFTSGAQITARMSRPTQKEDGKQYYIYWVQGGVSTNVANLRFKLILFNDNNEITDITSNVSMGNSMITANEGIPFNFGRPQPFQFESSQKYSKACIKFEVNNLRAYFDLVSSNVNSERMLCQKVVAE